MHKLTPIQAIRFLTAIINPEQAVNVLAYVNMLARWLDNDKLLDRTFLLGTFSEIGIALILEDR